MSGTIYSLIPPLLAILMVIVTRRVLLSLGVGILSAALLLHEFSITEAGKSMWGSFSAIFVSDGALNTWNVYIIFFLLLLGLITAFISISGGSRAFGEWALKRVKTRVGAHLVTAFLGIIIFIDDYFNSLAVGQVSRPLTDRHRISRAKLAYLIDSTSAPICVVSPVSSWGAYIIGIIGTILAAHSVADITPFAAFVQMIPMNFYVISAIAMVFIVSIYNVNLGAMKTHEQRAIDSGNVVDPDKKEVPGELKENLPVSDKGSVWDLVLPILALIVGVVVAMIWTGWANVAEGTAVTALAIFENTDVTGSLLYGGLFGLLVTLIMFIRQATISQKISFELIPKGIVEGIKSMLPAIWILLLAWMIVDLIGQLETGVYLAGLVESSNINIGMIPVIMFLIAGIMAFSTGTSWGTFGLMLPIAGQIAATVDITILLPAMSAVLAGSVFGDHCSPISDTTILSSTGAGSHHIDHVLTQLPYAIIAAVVASIGYLVLGFTNSTLIGLAVVLLMLVGIFIFAKQKQSSSSQAVNAAYNNK
ncbi:Na+/H+ antiporter NhaC family protein [Bacillus sp. SCS-151]|uniref:Na+/H+ antiporter NhaC family protein n=1 Tax=Nanhaiella sioensis TaxID=3115293 RepID=UPI00397DB323